jgi:predicted nucleic acid-binding protein
VRLFLDTSVLLAAAGSATGASRAIFEYARAQGWRLIASSYVTGEVVRNLRKLPASATAEWVKLRRALTVVDDVVTLDRIVIFPAGKDRPVLLTAFASSQVLLTLDRADFAGFLGHHFYGMPILTPLEFLEAERRANRL